MSRISYVNGRFVPHRNAAVHIEDRGYQFADSIYEVICVVNNHIIDEEQHLQRLQKSLSNIEIPMPVTLPVMKLLIRETIRRNNIGKGRGSIYIQVTRGVSPRIHSFPNNIKPSIIIVVKPIPDFDLLVALKGIKAIAIPDLRWKRADIKSTGLLANVLAKEQAHRFNAEEALLFGMDGMITEGSSSNVWIVTQAGALVTRKADGSILDGVTRTTLLKMARDKGIDVIERSFSLNEAEHAKEAFITGSITWIKPIVEINGIIIGDWKAGPITQTLLESYMEYVYGDTP